MTTTIRHVTLKSLGKNKDIDPSKGTVTNPFTQEEYIFGTAEFTINFSGTVTISDN